LGDKPRLTLGSLEAFPVLGECGGQDLDRQLALDLGFGRPLDLAHAAFAQLGGNLGGAESCSDQGEPLIAG